jgi:hypothetical protein
MPLGQNGVIALVVLSIFLVVGLVLYKGKSLVKDFAHAMFTARQAQQQEQQPPV